MKNRVNNVIRIPASLEGSFFKYWFLFLEPFHHLTAREIDVIACFVKQRFELSKVIKDDTIDEAGPITYYVLKKLGVKVPALSSDDEKIDWFNQSFYGAYNPSEDKDNDTFEPEEVVPQKETPKKKKRFFGLF